MAKAYFAAGCFWGVEETFRKLGGVQDTSVGYGGGHVDEPTYKQVCGGATGHAEAVEVEYDPTKISYEALLEVFWRCHDPTTRDRQGPDVGSQYRSAVFTLGEAQQEAALKSKAARQASLQRPIVTEITQFSNYYLAEDYHQQYVAKQRSTPRRLFGGLFSSAPH